MSQNDLLAEDTFMNISLRKINSLRLAD